MKKILLLLLMALSISQAAVHVNPNGLGEVLLIPYYTTNNGLNTLVTVSNTTEKVKAVKIVFREGLSGSHNQAISVYLAPYDAWAFGLVHRDDDAEVVSQDLSCAPFFTSPTWLYDHLGADPPPPNGFGFDEGSIEIYEMGELDPSYGYGQAVTFEDGLPRDCGQIERNWTQVGVWGNDQGQSEVLPATGGLKSSVAIINVESGVNYTYDAIALNGFYSESQIIHTHPNFAISPSLRDADTTSMVQYQGQNLISQWPTGIEAVSAVLSRQELMFDFSNNMDINAQTEVILSFPTRARHLIYPRLPPFEFIEVSSYLCELFSPTIVDRDGQGASYVPGSVSPIPPHLCKSTNVIKIWDVYDSTSVNYPILDSEHTYNQSIYKGKEGMYKIKFNQFTANGRSLDGSEIHTYHGLPVFALALTRYTNANAQPGLLAQYGGAFVPSSQQKIEIEQADQ